MNKERPLCEWCGESVLPDEQQVSFTQPMHRECGFRSVAGSVGHILRRCSCCSKESNLGDPPGLTQREAARAAFALWCRICDWYGEEVKV